jgi:hypothetical protein
MRVLGNTTNINNYLSVGAAGAINQASSAAVNNPIYEGLQDGGGSIGWRTVNNSLKYFQLLNFASSRSSLINLAQGNSTANSQTLQTNSLIVTAQDSTGVVQDMKLWAKDSNNGNRCSANYGAGLGFEIATTGQTDPYVTGTGNAGSYNIIINSAAAAVFNFTGSSIVIKTSSFDGDLTTTGSVIFAPNSKVSNGTVDAPNIIQDTPTNLTGVRGTGNLNYNTNVPITVTFTDCDIFAVNNTGSAIVNIVRVNSTIGTVGNNVVAEQFATISAPNLLSGSRVRVYDEDNAVELFNGVLASAGFSQSFVYTADTTVTLTATYVSGATAKLGLSATGIFTATGVTFLASQEDDTVYNGYAINGSTVTGFAADYVNDDINLSMSGDYTGEDLYAWWVYNETTALGISDFFGGITALDSGNLRINTSVVNLFLDNSTANFIYQNDTVRIFRSDGVYPARVVTTGGGGIDVNWKSNVFVGDSPDLAPIKKNTDLIPALL